MSPPKKDLIQGITAVINDEPASLPGFYLKALEGLSRVYSGVVKLRTSAYQRAILPRRKLPCPVVSIGNIAVGGTGKTPMAIYLAKLPRDLGHRTVIISRGYKGGFEKKGGIVSDGFRLAADARSAGDEPFMMARALKGIPVIVGHDRHRSGRLAIERFDPDIILLDDGFQHLKLHRDLDIVLLDARRPFGNRHLLPRGNLREPISALCRAGTVILTRYEAACRASLAETRRAVDGQPVFACRHQPVLLEPVSTAPPAGGEIDRAVRAISRDAVRGKRVFGFCGLARNDLFRETLAQFPFEVAGFEGFADHHPFTYPDLARLRTRARDKAAHVLCTTEKDFVRIPSGALEEGELLIIGIDIVFPDEGFDVYFTGRVRKLLEAYRPRGNASNR